MRSIAVMNQKGGVGKTTTAVNLGVALAEAGQRVCLVDLDPQAHASLHVGMEPRENRPSVYDVLVGQSPLREVRQEVYPNFWVVPSDLDLAAAEVELAGVVGREMILRDKLQEDGEPFDYLVVDCPPSLGVLTLNALGAVAEVLIPLQPQFLALHGLSKLLETIELVAKRINPLLRVTGVVFCMYDATTRLAQEVIRDVEEFFASADQKPSPWSQVRIFQTRIRRNVRLAEAPSFGQSIFHYAPQSPGAEDYRALAEEFQRTTPR